MRLLLDQGVPRDAADGLRALGHDCTHVSEIQMSAAADEEIIAFAVEHKTVAITLDADFHAILAVKRATGPSVVRLRIQGLNGPAVVEILSAVLSAFGAELDRGALVTVKARKVTSHKLPIGG
jgi:predicted nuclease of predicted toxin-antitoxin system